MRCQRCGFEIEPGQTFCSMCGTEQSRAERQKKKSPKSILWVIKIASKAHMKMWFVFLATLVMSIVLFALFDRNSPLVMSVLLLDLLLIGYELVYVMIGYKNPNSTKTKSYKIKYRMCAILAVVLFLFAMFMDFADLTTAVHNFITNNR